MTIRIALACSGLGHVRRGFETFMNDLFSCLTSLSGMEVTLFKGGGVRGPREVPLRNIPRGSPVWRLTGGLLDPYVGEQISFAFALALRLKRVDFDIVHLSDGQLGSMLMRLAGSQSKGFRLLYSNGGPLDPPNYEMFDFVQQVNPVELERASEHGYPTERMALVPYGIFHDRFDGNDGNHLGDTLRIQENVPVVLSVGAHGGHKRLEFLIRQMARVNASFHLLILGEEDRFRTPILRSIAKDLLGKRVTFIHLPHDSIPSAYAQADVYVHTALKEGMPLALLEAMAAGLPVVHHDESGMNWLVRDGGLAVDMTSGENLTETMNAVLTDSTLLTRLGQRGRRRAESRFSWQAILPQYVEMYEEALRLPRNR